MGATLIEILVLILLIMANGLFALSELALISARKVRLQQRAEEGKTDARAALELAENPSRLLSSVQIGITLISIVSGAVGGVTLGNKLGDLLVTIPFLREYGTSLGIAIVVVLITYFSLVFGELIPKRLALTNPEKSAMAVAGIMKALAWVTRPVVTLLSHSTDLGLRLLGVTGSTEPPVTSEEIKGLMEQGAQVGVFEETEQDMVESVFRFGDRTIDALMTPRTEIEWLDLDEPFAVLLEQVMDSHYSRFPAAHGSLDAVQGILLARDLMAMGLHGDKKDADSAVQPPLFVPESMTAPRVLELFKESGLHVALVIDEYGGLLGMVTPHDILTSLVGELPAAGEESGEEATQREDGSWLLDGLLPVDELKDILDIEDLPEEDRVGYQTLGGLVMSALGEIPAPGKHFDWAGWRFEVMDMDGRRVDKVLAVKEKA